MGIFVSRPPDCTEPIEEAQQTVLEQFDMAADFALNAYEKTQELLEALGETVKELEIPDSEIEDVIMPGYYYVNYDGRPTEGRVDNVIWPSSEIEKPSYIQPSDLDNIDIPFFNLEPPAYYAPDKPVLDTDLSPGEAPVLEEVEVPPAPELTLPDPPVLNDIILPSPPDISIPEFDANLPVDDIPVPDNFSWTESPYNSDVWDSLLEKILDGIVNGCTGLDPEIEQAIWDRALQRQAIEDDRLFRKIRDTYSERGYNMPPGAMAGAEIEAWNEIGRRDELLNADIAIKQAELAQANTHFMVDKGVGVEQILREFHNAQANRSLEAAKTLVTASVEIHNALVRKFAADVDRYRAQGDVYKSRVQAALAQVEIFKSQVEAAKVSADIQAILVDIYDKQVRAVDTLAKLYVAELEGVKTKAEIQKLKLDSFEIQTRSYIAMIDFEKRKLDIYLGEMEGERIKADIYGKRVSSYMSEVEATKIKSDIQINKLESELRTNQQLIDQYKAEVQKYSVDVEAVARQVSGTVEIHKANVMAYSAEVESDRELHRLSMDAARVNIDTANIRLQQAIADIKAATDGYIAIKKLQTEGVQGMTNVSAQLAASAMNAVNASAGMTYHASSSKSCSNSHSEGLSESHTFKEK